MIAQVGHPVVTPPPEPNPRRAETEPTVPTIATTTCTACTQATAGTRMSRHTVSDGWLTYYRCGGCRGVSAVHTPRITWVG